MSNLVNRVRGCLSFARTARYLPGLAVSCAVALLLLISGIWYFRQTERQFADII